MYYALSLMMGVLISVMVAFNGGLTNVYGIFTATVIIHIAGLLLISIMVLLAKENPFTEKHAWYLYLGGALGIFTTIFNNLAFGMISVSAILALGLLGQSVMGVLIDEHGFFGMQKHKFNRRKIIGIILILAGISAMINNFQSAAVIVSFMAGVNIVLSRTLNAKLSEASSIKVSTFYNYFIGLILSAIVLLIMGRGEIIFTNPVFIPNPLIYLGGILGVCVVLTGNVTAPKISAFYLTLLIFVGQIFSGVMIDMAIDQAVSLVNIVGGVFVAAGLCVNLLLDSSFIRAKS